jgi:hypothetical protein
VIFDPFREHLIALPVLLYKVLQATFGMTSAVPYYVAAMLAFATAAALIFAFLRTRVGEWLAFAAILPILFLGASSEDLLWAFQVGFFGSVAAGVGMLLALDRGDRRGDVMAAALAIISLAFGSVGIPFVIAAIVDVLVGPRPRRDRAFVAVVPIAVYAFWWIGWGYQAHHSTDSHNFVDLPGYVFNAAGAGVAALFGQQVNSNSDPGHPPVLFRVLAGLVAVALGVKVVRERRISRGLAVTLTIAFSFWILAGLDSNVDRPPIANRYQYPSAVFIVLIAGEAFRGLEVPRLATIVVLGVAVLAALGGISLLNRDRPSWNGFAESTRSVLAAVELSGTAARPGYLIAAEQIDGTVAQYRDAVGRFGSPAYGEAELLDHAGTYGEEADQTMVGALGIMLRSKGAPRPGRSCERLASGASAGGFAVRAQTVTLVNQSRRPAGILLGRFAAEPDVRLGTVAAGSKALLRLPRGDSPRPWRLGVAHGVVVLCPVG